MEKLCFSEDVNEVGSRKLSGDWPNGQTSLRVALNLLFHILLFIDYYDKHNMYKELDV